MLSCARCAPVLLLCSCAAPVVLLLCASCWLIACLQAPHSCSGATSYIATLLSDAASRFSARLHPRRAHFQHVVPVFFASVCVVQRLYCHELPRCLIARSRVSSPVMLPR